MVNMKIKFLVLNLMVGLSFQQEVECDWLSGHVHFRAYPGDCTKFTQCAPTGPVTMTCPAGTYWSQDNKICDIDASVCSDLHEVSFKSYSKRGGIAQATDTHSGFRPPAAFEGSYFTGGNPDIHDFWHSNSDTPSTLPKSLWYEFPEKIRVVKYSFRSRNTGDRLTSTDGPSKYVFWASNAEDCSDETQWDKLYEDNSGTPFDLDNTPKVMTISNNNFYRCYGFKVTDVPGRDRATRWNKVGDKHVTISDVRFYTITG